MEMIVLKTKNQIRQWRRSIGENSLGFVPTMGALHQGHLSLVAESVKQCSFTLVSIFVNPMQFGPKEDFTQYPRPIQEDLDLLKKAGVSAVYLPEVGQILEADRSILIQEDSLSKQACGRFRPGHFSGVLTIVAKLFNLVQPKFAYFGQKDAQQCALIEKLIRELDFDIELIRLPIFRENDGLAMSSRNQYLSKAERELAPLIYKNLLQIKQKITQGTAPQKALKEAQKQLEETSELFKVQYLEYVDPAHFSPVTEPLKKGLIIAAVYLGRTRLIDNLVVS